MRVAISTLIVRPGLSGSNESYLQELITALQAVDTDNEYLLFVTPQNEKLFPITNPHWRTVRVPGLGFMRAMRILIDQLVLPCWAWGMKVDVLHYPGTVGSCLNVAHPRQVVTVHYDLDPVHAPSVPRLKRGYFSVLMRRMRTTAQILVVPSRGFAATFGPRWNISPEKMRIVYHGVRPPELNRARWSEEAGAFLKARSLIPGYLLSVTNALPHKNVVELLEAYTQLIALVPSAPPLVLAGSISSQDLDQWQKQLALKRIQLPRSRLKLTGFIPARQMEFLYHYAIAMVTPTFTESSSMPVLEAMAGGCPVIASDIDVHQEIAGDAAVLVPLRSPELLADACVRILTDPSWREQLVQRGAARAACFRWEGTAHAMIASYQDAAHAG